ncbi:MAG TPA: hypothetical protein VF121_11745 [Thermoanaerobaculia bacterium]|nr:hypothetical protein [Thermoanaerobaculia bacterium]
MEREDETLREAERALEEARRDLELRLGELRTTVETELGFVPRHKYLLLGVLAGAGGLAFALRRGRRKKKRSLGGRGKRHKSD